MSFILRKILWRSGQFAKDSSRAPQHTPSTRGMHGTAHHAPTHSPLNLRPSGPVVHTQMRPPWTAHGTGATLSDATRISSKHTANRRCGANRGTQTASPAWNLQASTPPNHSTDPRQSPRCERDGPVEAAGLGTRHSSRSAHTRSHTVTDAAHRMSEHRPTHARALLTAC